MTQSILTTGMARCLPKIKTDSLLITLVLWVSLTWAERNHSQNSVVKNQLEENATDQEPVPVSWKRGFRTVSNHTKYLKSLPVSPTSQKSHHFQNASLNESINSGHLKTEDGTFQACEMCLDRDLQGQCLTMSKGSAQQVYSLQKTKRYLVNYKKWNAVCQNWNLFSISWTFRKWEFLFFMLDHVSSILPKAERLQIRQHLWKCAIMWY